MTQLYVVEFPSELNDGSKVWRVAECCCIENCNDGTIDEQDAYRAAVFGLVSNAMFGRCKVFFSEEAASIFAEQEAYDLGCEIVSLTFDRPLKRMTESEISLALYGRVERE